MQLREPAHNPTAMTSCSWCPSFCGARLRGPVISDGATEGFLPQPPKLPRVLEAAARRNALHAALRIIYEVARYLELYLGGELLRGDAGRSAKHAGEVARAHRGNPRQLGQGRFSLGIPDDEVL